MRLTAVQEKFILHWGEMGSRWGVNRTMAQIHALLYLSDRPLAADEIAQTLKVARSNVSTSVRELQTWRVIHVVHVMGDRRDHFESLTDIWDMFMVVLEERKRREIDPTIRVLRECLADMKKSRTADKLTRQRLQAMLGFFEECGGFFNEIRQVPHGLMRFMRLGAKVRRLIGSG